MSTARRAVALWALFLLVTAEVAAAPPSPALERLISEGVACYQQLNYGCAIEKLQKALLDIDTGGAVTEELEVRARLHLAFSLIAVERKDDARSQLRRVLKLKPRFSLDRAILSPRIVDALEEVRRELIAPGIQVELDPGEPVELSPPPAPPLSLFREVAIGREGDAEAGGVARPWAVDLGGGATVLTGEDATRYGVGPGLSLRLLRRFGEIWAAGFGSHLNLHPVDDLLDLKNGGPNALWVLSLQPQAGLSAPVTRWLILDALAVAGAAVYGHDGLSGGTAFHTGLHVGARFVLSEELAVGVHASPLLAIGEGADETAQSLSFPLTAEASFSF